MDVPRPKKANPKKYVFGGVAAAAVIMTTFGLSRLKPAAPTVDRATIWTDEVERGTLVRKVRGPGTLVPEEIRLIPAVTAGRVERKLVQPGEQVEEGTVLLQLSNPDVELQLLQAQAQAAQARATLDQLRTNLEGQRLQQVAQVAQVRTQRSNAQRQLQAVERLYPDSLASRSELDAAREQLEELDTRLRAEESRLANLETSIPVQIASQEDEIRRLQSIVDAREEYRQSMTVRAGVTGVLQQMNLEEGQWVLPGTELARVVQPGRLKAVLRVPETQARDVIIGQTALVDTRNDTIMGRVVRIDPAATNGTVGVDVALPDSLPRSARPDLTVDGLIEIERLDDVLFTGRPAYGQSNSAIGMFRIVPNQGEAVRVRVTLGVSSVNEVQIIDGLAPGDSVILSDMSQWDEVDRVRLR